MISSPGLNNFCLKICQTIRVHLCVYVCNELSNDMSWKHKLVYLLFTDQQRNLLTAIDVERIDCHRFLLYLCLLQNYEVELYISQTQPMETLVFGKCTVQVHN